MYMILPKCAKNTLSLIPERRTFLHNQFLSGFYGTRSARDNVFIILQAEIHLFP